MSKRAKRQPTSEERWRATTNARDLIRWSRGHPNPRKYLLLGCALVRHGPGGVRTDLGRRILDVIEDNARRMGPGHEVGRLLDLLVPSFPGLFRGEHPHLADHSRRKLDADVRWVWRFLQHAAVPARTTKALPNVLLDCCLADARARAAKEAEEEVAAIRRGLAADMPPPQPGPLRTFFGLSVPAPAPSPEQLRAAILARLPASFVPGDEPTQALELHRHEEWQTKAEALLADLVREVFGDPFRRWHPCPEWLAANTGAARRLAEHIDQSGAYAELPILGDALEDAGCSDEEVLRHCRAETIHVPGCWVIAAVLGR